MALFERLRNVEVIVTLILAAGVVFGMGAGAVMYADRLVTPIDERSKDTQARVMRIEGDMALVKQQVEDALDARIEYVYRQIVQLENKSEHAGGLSATELEYLKTQRREYERLKKLRYGKE